MRLSALVLLCVVSYVHGAIQQDLITDLPGLSKQPSFKQYSGYLKSTGNKKLHYWFVESQNDPAKDPVVLWMNGGPGCSSMDGLLSEHGPFLAVNSGKSLKDNPYSWNTVANMLYLEAPAGVGYSYSSDRNYTISDNQVATDNYMALKYFFQNFVEFVDNEFFVTGESYGGVYVPTLSALVSDDSDFNFKGFAVGNGITDWAVNDNSLIYFGYYHGLIGPDLWAELVKYCCKDGHSDDCPFSSSTNPSCQNAVNEFHEQMSSLNIYNLYGECYHQPGLENKTVITPESFYLFASNPIVAAKRKKMLSATRLEDLKEVPPCIDATDMTNYMNRKDVRKAIHILDTLPAWEVCSAEVGAHYVREYTNMKEKYMHVLNKNLPVLIYNGDIDMACNFLGDSWFSETLEQKVVDKRKPWFYTAEDGTKQNAGYVKQFDKLTVVTIRGAGHMVPSDKPIPALDMFKRFLKGTKY